MFDLKNRAFLFLLASATAFSIAACSDDDDNGGNGTPDTGTDTTEPPVDMAMVRVMHASWDAPAVDIYINGAAPEAGSALDAITFGNGTAYLEVPAGSYDIAVVPDGGTLEDAVFSADGVALGADTATTFWAYGGLGSESFGVGVISDPTDVSEEEVTLIVAHAAANVGPVDVWVDGDPTLLDIDISEATSPANLPTGTYEVGVALAGEESTALDFTAPLTSPAFITVFAVGDLEEEIGVYLVALLPNGTTLAIQPIER